MTQQRSIVEAASGIVPSELTVVIPSFNEAEAIGGVVAELRQALPGIAILVIDDGSADATGEVAAVAGATVIRHRRNLGYGASLRTGIHAARTPYVAMYDADGQHRPEDLRRLMDQAADADMVIGARDKNSPQVASRRPGKWVLACLAETLVGQRIPDLNSGLRVMRQSVIRRYMHLFPRGFSASTTMTMCMLSRGYEVRFVPITTRPRGGGRSSVRGADGLATMRLIVRLIILFNRNASFSAGRGHGAGGAGLRPVPSAVDRARRAGPGDAHRGDGPRGGHVRPAGRADLHAPAGAV